jgi:hypothetical protein
LYFIGWIVVAIMFWTTADFMTLVVVNLVMATTSVVAYRARHPHFRSLLHGVLIAITIYGLIFVWATPSLDW